MFNTASQFSSLRRPGLVTRVVLIVALGTMPFATGCASDKKVIEQANEFHGELNKAVITDPQMANYIQSVGGRIVETAGRLYGQGYRPKSKTDEASDWMFSKAMEFHFVNSKTLNAFTTGGEHMYVYTELLRRAHNEDELAAVMAHEYGHVFGRHIHKGMNRQLAVLFGSGAAAAAGYVAGGEEYAGYGAGLGAVAGGLANAGFSRGDESEADKLGFDFYVRSGWDPDKFAGFFRTILEEEKKAGSGGAGAAFFSDHPATAERIANAEKWSAEWKAKHPDWQQRLKPDVATQAQFVKIQRRSVEIGKSMPDDTSLNQQTLLAALPRSCMFPDEPQPPAAQQAQQKLAAQDQQSTRQKKKSSDQ